MLPFSALATVCSPEVFSLNRVHVGMYGNQYQSPSHVVGPAENNKHSLGFLVPYPQLSIIYEMFYNISHPIYVGNLYMYNFIS